MKEKFLLFGIAVFLCTIFYIPIAHSEVLPSIIISEIQVTGGAGHTADDFVELYNTSSASVNISNYRLRYKNSSGTENSLNKISADVCIAPHGYYLWANKDGAFASNADTKTGTNIASDYSLAFLVPESLGDTIIIDSVSWGSKSHPFDLSAFHFANNPSANESMIRNIVTNNWLADFSKTPTPTKSVDTSCPVPPPTPDPIPDVTPPTTPSTIRINEIFPNPEAKNDAGEFIELYNFGTEPVDISSWILRDASKTGKYVFPDKTIITASAYFVVSDQDFKLSLNNSNETISLFDKDNKLIDSAHYEKTKNGVSLNYTSAGWRGGTPTPGAPNQINNLPETSEKVPRKGYRGTPVIFNAKGKDPDGDTLKYVWNFGDGHKSYKEKTSHKYEENGVYTITLTTTDGSDDVTETFTLKIESYPHPKIRITSFVPNPAGKDTDNEWMMLENRGKKTVNLKGFSIATGWKNIVNHPIREDFIIKSGQEIKLTRANSLFTLPNQKGKVELHAPDGKVLQKIKYKLKESAAEDAVYRKKKGERWNLEETAEEPAETNAETAPSNSEENSDTEESPISLDINAQPEEENQEENPDFQETEKLEGAVLGASVVAENGEKTDQAESQEPEYPIVFWIRKTLSDINASLNNIFNISQN
jgi:hypothetical protein